jgi:ATP-dependent helicase HrpA
MTAIVSAPVMSSPSPLSPTLTFDQLRDRLPALMLSDQRRLGRRIDRLRQPGSQDDPNAQVRVAAIAREIEEAERRVQGRRASAPRPTYPAGLPVVDKKDDILAAIQDHQVVIVAGETGSGKSTQLPKMCLELGRGVQGLIGHTQPRRLAARAVAERVADELGTTIGEAVGYTVRFTDQVGDDTLVKVMTDGILLAEIQRDPQLSRYDTLIIDEAHERSLNIDFILGYLTRLLPRRPDLKLLITSATIDTQRFSEHFGGAPVVDVTGRSYPVELRYRPLLEDDPRADADADTDTGRRAPAPAAAARRASTDRDQVQAICDAVEELSAEGPGDILVFLSGEREIRDTAEALRAQRLAENEILPLYARLSIAEQHRVFQPHPGRRVVLATNVAETSLTVPGIRYVVDPGTARISRYNRRTKVQRLPIEAVSQASANQRAGRCGRVAPGICIRLYAEDDFDSRPPFTEPEILRTNLAAVLLQMAALGLGDVASFPFVDPPDRRAVADGIALLEELGALDPTHAHTKRWLTPSGRQLAQLPLDPRLGRMVLEAARHGCVREVMVIAAALSIQDPRERPAEKLQAAAEAHNRFVDKDSDFITYVRLWDYLREQQRELSSSAFRRLCRAEFLNYLRVREWQDIYSQLGHVCRSLGIRVNHDPGDGARIHRSLLAGLLSHIGLRDPSRQDYQGARNARFAIAAGSALANRAPRWVMAAELVETSRLWARGVARIQPEWAESLGAHLVKRSYGEPWWDRARGAVMVNERVTLYGVPIVASRTVPFSRVDAALARELFIRHALVDGDWGTHHAFVARNEQLVEEVLALEDRARRRDILIDDEARFGFFDQRVGPEVASGRHFDQWWKGARARQPDLLNFRLEQLIHPDSAPVSSADFPDVWRQGELVLPLSYEFEPGSARDGVTVEIPLALLNQVDPAGFDWQVPGLRLELVTALIRSLPKPVRRNVVPAPEYARKFLDRADPRRGPLADELEHELGRLTGSAIAPGSCCPNQVPDHLRIAFRVVDDQGRTVAESRDLEALAERLGERVRSAIARAVPTVERSGLRTWSIGTLPRKVASAVAGQRQRVLGYPALVDEGDSVAVRLLASEDEQRLSMWAGTRRLLQLMVPFTARELQNRLPNDVKLAFAQARHHRAAELFADCTVAALDQLIADRGGPAWDAVGFEALRGSVRSGLLAAAVQVASAAGRVLSSAQAVEDRLGRLVAAPLQASVDDVVVQVARLVHPGFVSAAGAARLPDLVRYLRAVERRLEKLPADPARDRERMQRVQRLEREYDQLLAALPVDSRAQDARRIRWMIEELRVSFFAQALGTPQPISEERIERAMDDVAAGVPG